MDAQDGRTARSVRSDSRLRLGLIVNPIAGLGGRLGFKGSDDPEIVRRARALGAVPEAGDRARRALALVRALAVDVDLLAGPGEMGADAAREAGFDPIVVGSITSGATRPSDTRAVARAMRDLGVDLLVFSGGDGTARDICDAIGTSLQVLGVAAGVKVYSGAFAVNPERAGELIAEVATGRAVHRDVEVLDIDEVAYREGRVSPSLHGYLRIAFRQGTVQGGKAPSPPGDALAMAGIAAEVIAGMAADRAYILGPGTTTGTIARGLGLGKTLVGVDVITSDRVLVADASEGQLLELIARRPASIVVTPIGGQGFVFGRGNPQIGPRVLERVAREEMLVVATAAKLAALEGRPFLVDTGDAAVDESLVGYLPVVTGHRERSVYRVAR